MPREVVVPKRNGYCSLSGYNGYGCRKCNKKYYLVPYSNSIKIRNEALSWTLSLDAGRGLDDLPYKHLTHIPVYMATQNLWYLTLTRQG